jgi:hypothetical protein
VTGKTETVTGFQADRFYRVAIGLANPFKNIDFDILFGVFLLISHGCCFCVFESGATDMIRVIKL